MLWIKYMSTHSERKSASLQLNEIASNTFSMRTQITHLQGYEFHKIVWTTRESNPRPWACKAHALPIEPDAPDHKTYTSYCTYQKTRAQYKTTSSDKHLPEYPRINNNNSPRRLSVSLNDRLSISMYPSPYFGCVDWAVSRFKRLQSNYCSSQPK